MKLLFSALGCHYIVLGLLFLFQAISLGLDAHCYHLTNALALIDAHSHFLKQYAFCGPVRYCSSAKPLSPEPTAFTWSFISTHILCITPHRLSWFGVFFASPVGHFPVEHTCLLMEPGSPLEYYFHFPGYLKYRVFQGGQVSVKCILTFVHLLFASHQEVLLI